MVFVPMPGASAPSHTDDSKPKAPSSAELVAGFCNTILTPEFFEKHWERYPLHHRAAEHGKTANQLPSVLTVDDVVALIRCSGSNLKMFKKGVPFDSESLFVGYLEGASCIVNQADRHNSTLFSFCRALAERNFLHAFAVIYLTPPKSQAVRLHNDDQDVFLCQIWGRKKWTIREAPKLLPYTEEMLGKDTPVPEELVGKVIMEFTMEPGDVLYIPRGYLHEAATGEEHSLHTTITIPTSDYCWGVQLLKHMMSSFHTRDFPPHLQQLCSSSMSVQGRAGPKAMDDAALDEKLQELFQAWNSNLQVDGVLDAFEQRMARTNDGQEISYRRCKEMRIPPCVTEESRVRLMHGVTCFCEADTEYAVFARSSDGQRLEMPIAKSSSGMIRGLTSKPQSVKALPCEDAFERICVLQMLHEQGVVQLFIQPAADEQAPQWIGE